MKRISAIGILVSSLGVSCSGGYAVGEVQGRRDELAKRPVSTLTFSRPGIGGWCLRGRSDDGVNFVVEGIDCAHAYTPSASRLMVQGFYK